VHEALLAVSGGVQLVGANCGDRQEPVDGDAAELLRVLR